MIRSGEIPVLDTDDKVSAHDAGCLSDGVRFSFSQYR